ncbi:transmembrane 7 superfamily member 3 isoform X1 [Hypanus sabinus]|uniref:transmembrane 7 superfamily member 3 isoform X1 n=1 Tax=Hypanus sabinus TaxID=79690 RepID=UPI0028C4595A|nr:transmembrane 7 superfamily member 3 isoform X1 [Hypanus sabinus]
MSPCRWLRSAGWAGLLCLELVLCQSIPGQTEFKLGRFQKIPLIENTSFEASLWNIPNNVTFVNIQVHTQYVNTTLSLESSGRGPLLLGADLGLLLNLKPRETAFKWQLYTRAQNASAVSVLLPYSAQDPVPGGCSSGSNVVIDPNLYLEYDFYEARIRFSPANVGYARGAPPPVCVSTGRLQYDVYQYFLPEGDLSEETLFTSLQKMAEVQKVEENGVKLFSLGTQDKTAFTVSSIRGQGVIYNVVVKDLELNTSAAYTLVHTYGCNFTAQMDSCHTLRRRSTQAFFVVVGLLGLFVCFFGHSYLKTEFFFIGFLILGFLSFIFLMRTFSLDYDVVLSLTAVLGLVGGALLVLCWWSFGSIHFAMLPVGLVLGFLFTAVVVFTPVGNIEVFQDDSVFWILLACLAILVPLASFSCPRALNITACGLIGSYAVILAIHTFVFTSLAYITFNVLKRALDDDFKAAFTNVPFQLNDYILLSVWVVLLVSGMVFQFVREKDQPVFPPHPYQTWKRKQERRKTNVLDPSHHIPPLKDRLRNKLIAFKQIFVKPPPRGEQTPLLL